MINLYNKDCMEALKEFKDNQFDLAIVDPPYRDAKDNDMNQWNRKYIENGRLKNWNDKPTKEYFDELFRVSKNQIIWGANNFTLPQHKGYVVWRKKSISQNFNMSMCDFAYISEGLGTISKMFEYIPQIKNRIHPTEKPIILYKWLLEMYGKKGDKILDTHLGSGSIAIACHNLGFDLEGYELDKEYFEAAKKRLHQHQSQIRMFQ